MILKPTRTTDRSSTLIDVILITDSMTSLHSDTIDIDSDVSDHKAITTYLKFHENSQSCTKRKVWNYDRGDYDRLNKLIDDENWNYINDLTIDESCSRFTQTILSFMTLCIPSKDVTIRPNDKPWYDSVIRRTSRARDRQRTKATRTTKTADWTNYKKLRNKVNNLKKHAKEQFYNNIETTIASSMNTNRQTYWKLLKSFIKNNKHSDSIPILKTVTDNNETLNFTDEDKANCLNDYSCSISTIDDSNVDLPILNKTTDSQLSFITITEKDISDMINS